ncbi:MAG: nucleotide exchange factor GrpE [Spirochaetota bacterium]|jgi:hypothetical protein|nr:nucleotide exchange factor GrpE [Spirochaetota bacterium]
MRRILTRQAYRLFFAVFMCLTLCSATAGLPSLFAAFEDADEADYDTVFPGQGSRIAAVGEGAQEQFSSLVNQVIDVNTRFAVVFIAIAAAIMLLVLLLLFRLGGIRNSLVKSARDMSNTKDALRYLMDVDKQGAAKKSAQPEDSGSRRAESGTQTDAAIARVMAEMEKLAKRMDDLPQPQASAKKRLYDEEELTRELDRRLEALHIEIIEPAAGDKYDPLLHDEVDSKPSRVDLDGTIFRVIQNGLAYNNRVALKSRVVVHRA